MRNIKEVEEIKNKYKVGDRIKLICMDDDFAVPSGTYGTIDYIDDDGQIHMNWENGRTIPLIYGVDKFEVINIEEKINI